MERIRVKMLVTLLLLCLSVPAQIEYSGIAGASPGMVRANKQAAAKQANRNSKAASSSNVSKFKTSDNGNANSSSSTYASLPDNDESDETEVRDGFKTLSRGMSRVIKRETRTMGEVIRKIGADGKKFFKKLGKGISDSFKPDMTASKQDLVSHCIWRVPRLRPLVVNSLGTFFYFSYSVSKSFYRLAIWVLMILE